MLNHFLVDWFRAIFRLVIVLTHLIAPPAPMHVMSIYFDQKSKFVHFFSMFILILILQWLVGLCMYMLPYTRKETRAVNLPWHISGGRAIFYMTIVAALTGLMQKITLMQLQLFSGESLLINFLAIFILLFGISVDISVALARYA